MLLIVLIGICYLIVLFKRRVVYGKYYKANRAKAETICSWEYSADEWQKYASEFQLSQQPKGAAVVRITPLDLWFTDDTDKLRKPIDSGIMMVTDCRYLNNILKIRTRSNASGRSDHYHSFDYLIPVPIESAREAEKAVDFFKNNIARHPKKLLLVTPPETITGLFGESDF